MDIKITKKPGSVVEIEGEIASDVFESYFKKALEKLGNTVKIDGFRQGKVPENILISNVGEMNVLHEMAEIALADEYPKILLEHKIDAIDRPEIAITKLARNNPLGFKIKTVVLPEIKIADYKEIAKRKNKDTKGKEINVTEEEIEKTIEDIRKSRAPKKHITEIAKEQNEESGDKKEPEIELPPFDDDFVKSLGDFKDIPDFKEKLKENIKLEKENLEREKNRLAIMEEVIEKSEMDLPELLIELEVDKILMRMEGDIAAMGLKFEDYLKHLNKSKEELRKDFRNDGEKKAKLALVLNKISDVEKIKADIDAVEKEVTHIMEHYKDADKDRARMYADNILTNEKIFQYLENL